MSQTSKRSIPAWQKSNMLPGTEKPSPAKETEPNETPPAAQNMESSSATSDTAERARKFLQDPSIRNAPKEKKLAFLQSKGLRKEDAESLLGESSSASTEEEEQPQDQSPSASAAPQHVQPRDVPPVITYPEFLVHANKPPPLVTTSFLFTTAYLASGLAASMWALSKYIVLPMQANLSECRHDFFTHTSTKLESLNSKLSSVVSAIPASRPTTTQGKVGDHPDNASESSHDSDPTELFHHDIGTQTSPTLLSRRSSLSSSLSSSLPTDTIAQHEERLRVLSSHLKDLQFSNREAAEKEGDMSSQLTHLNSYLSEMKYSNSYMSSKYLGPWSNLGAMGSAGNNENQDEIDRVMKDIRAVKGVLVNTRNFAPAGTIGTA
jgi:hypothetical protein